MFFPGKITCIKNTDRVLEIGPGGTPFDRSDVFLELKYEDEEEFRCQRGNTNPLITKKPVIFYDGDQFPFNDFEFDYVICSHVIEHVKDIDQFLSEMFRVSPKGYLEYPTILYEYLYNFPHHLNILKHLNNNLYYIKKSKTCLNEFLPVQHFYYESLEKGYTNFVNELKIYMFEGFEWTSPFNYEETEDIKKLIWDEYNLNIYTAPKRNILQGVCKTIFRKKF
jgi:ubiquinone/menaquinone biosynthesis C-methylase UbiE